VSDLFRDLNVPCAFNATFDALIRWTLLRVRRQRSVKFVATALWNRESVMKANPGNLQYTIDVLDVTFNIRHEILSRLDLPHIQCGPEGAEQSSGDTGNHVIECGWIFGSSDLASVLFLVEVLDAAMNAEVKRLIKPVNASRSVWSFVFGNLDFARVGN
jgi:hypothetical protein